MFFSCLRHKNVSAPAPQKSSTRGMEDTTSNVGNPTLPPSAPTTSDEWDTIVSDDFGRFCVRTFLERNLEETEIIISPTATDIEVLDIVTQDKSGLFFDSVEHETWNQFKRFREWFRTHEFEYDEQALFEMFMKGELPVAVRYSNRTGKNTTPTIAVEIGNEWNCDKFEKYLIDTSQDNDFARKWRPRGHIEYPFLKDTAITEHLNSGAMEGMPQIWTPRIRVNMQGYDYTIEKFNGQEIGTMAASKLVSTGTIERIVDGLDKKNKPTIKGKDTAALLTNIYAVHTTIRGNPDYQLTSIRYGTPVRKKILPPSPSPTSQRPRQIRATNPPPQIPR